MYKLQGYLGDSSVEQTEKHINRFEGESYDGDFIEAML